MRRSASSSRMNWNLWKAPKEWIAASV